jgi:septum formation protein
LAYQKASDVAHRSKHQVALGSMPNDGAIIVGCDTVAECAGQILGKPVDVVHARSMLTLLSGREHHVYSGLCLWKLPDDEAHVKVDRTTLQMDVLSVEQLEDYLASGLWEGKAGAFGYQDRVGWLRIIEGSESNVVGLPMEVLKSMLADIGYGS